MGDGDSDKLRGLAERLNGAGLDVMMCRFAGGREWSVKVQGPGYTSDRPYAHEHSADPLEALLVAGGVAMERLGFLERGGGDEQARSRG